MEKNQRLAYQGLLDNCNDVGITEAELQEAQAPLKPSIRRPEIEDWERMRKYFGNVPADMVCNTFKYTTQIGTLPPSSYLQRQFTSPNPALNGRFAGCRIPRGYQLIRVHTIFDVKVDGRHKD